MISVWPAGRETPEDRRFQVRLGVHVSIETRHQDPPKCSGRARPTLGACREELEVKREALWRLARQEQGRDSKEVWRQASARVATEL